MAKQMKMMDRKNYSSRLRMTTKGKTSGAPISDMSMILGIKHDLEKGFSVPAHKMKILEDYEKQKMIDNLSR